ncbi:hypothetical protein EI94DRAFT_1726610 [Lactarius quietus]|nr:hypothetical protein EI94DRAFT_1726610 [Lactarius quietus]
MRDTNSNSQLHIQEQSTLVQLWRLTVFPYILPPSSGQPIITPPTLSSVSVVVVALPSDSGGRDHIHACTAAVASCVSLNTRCPAVITELEEARRMFSTRSAQLAQRILNCTFGGRGGVHILRKERTREFAPEPAALVRFLCVFRRDQRGPLATHLAELRAAVLDANKDFVVSPGEKILGLKLEVGR